MSLWNTDNNLSSYFSFSCSHYLLSPYVTAVLGGACFVLFIILCLCIPMVLVTFPNAVIKHKQRRETEFTLVHIQESSPSWQAGPGTTSWKQLVTLHLQLGSKEQWMLDWLSSSCVVWEGPQAVEWCCSQWCWALLPQLVFSHRHAQRLLS